VSEPTRPDPDESATPEDFRAEELLEVEMTGPIPTIEGTGPIPAVAHDLNEVADEESMMKSSAIMAAGTIVSRITGVLRDTALTAALGLTIVRDAFALGNSLPNVIYILVVGGALNAVFVPQLVRRMKEDRDGGRAYSDALLTATSSVLLVVSVVSVLIAPWIVSLYATPSYSAEQTALAVAFARYCLPQIFFYGIYTMMSQVLNARGHFAMPMFAPIANNIVAIATYVGFIVLAGTDAAASGTLTAQETAWLGIGTTLGVVMQALILIPVLIRTGYRYSISWQWRGLGLTKALRLAIWTIGLVAANQVGFMVISRLATQANVNAQEAGEAAAGLATYQTGYLIFILPHSVVTVSIVTALLPSLSRTVHAGRLREAGDELSRAARIVVLLVAPMSVALFLLAGPVASLLFGYGAADPEQIEQLGTVTRVFALAILPFTVYYVLLRGWYAMEDTRTPFFLAVLLNVINIGCAIGLFQLLDPGAQQIYGLAGAFVIAYWSILVVGWPILAHRFGGLDTARTVWSLVRIVLAGTIALGVAWLAIPLTQYQVGGSKFEALVDVAFIAAVVLVAYALAVWVLRIREAKDLAEMVTGRLRRR
jgi:putative peptidoglycan lipid II flippase